MSLLFLLRGDFLQTRVLVAQNQSDRTEQLPNTHCSRYGSINIVCPLFNRETEGGRTFSVRMSRLWNSLPNELKSINSI